MTAADDNGSFESTSELDGAGKPTRKTDYEGLVTTIGYDVLGRAVRWEYGDEGVREVELDVNGAVTRTSFGTHQVSSTTDSLGRPGRTEGKGLDTSVERDAAGRVKQREDHEMGVTETFTYDVVDRVIAPITWVEPSSRNG